MYEYQSYIWKLEINLQGLFKPKHSHTSLCDKLTFMTFVVFLRSLATTDYTVFIAALRFNIPYKYLIMTCFFKIIDLYCIWGTKSIAPKQSLLSVGIHRHGNVLVKMCNSERNSISIVAKWRHMTTYIGVNIDSCNGPLPDITWTDVDI